MPSTPYAGAYASSVLSSSVHALSAQLYCRSPEHRGRGCGLYITSYFTHLITNCLCIWAQWLPPCPLWGLSLLILQSLPEGLIQLSNPLVLFEWFLWPLEKIEWKTKAWLPDGIASIIEKDHSKNSGEEKKDGLTLRMGGKKQKQEKGSSWGSEGP